MPAVSASPLSPGLEQLVRTSSPQPLPDAVDLVPFLAALADPWSRHGRRFPLAALAAAAGVLAGARPVTAIAEWIPDTPRWVLLVLGFPLDPFTRAVTVPHPTTVMRLLSRLDGDAFHTAVTTFLQARARRRQNGERGRLRAAAVGGKQLRGSRTGDGKAVRLLAAMDHTGTVLAQRQIDAKSNEPSAFIPLLDGLVLEDTVVTADAARPHPARPRPLAAQARRPLHRRRQGQPPRPAQAGEETAMGRHPRRPQGPHQGPGPARDPAPQNRRPRRRCSIKIP
ncbi:transposase family protein [Streptomyces glaucosporus]|uniref:transposase family protein n=1 Tax=Streptomyces glaucosporus TaxID=284044 RepID=UPI003CD0B5B7